MIVGVPVLLMRNLDIPRLRNGTRLKITHLGTNVVKATVMTDIGRRESVLIPLLPIIPKDLSSQLKREMNSFFACLKKQEMCSEEPIESFPVDDFFEAASSALSDLCQEGTALNTGAAIRFKGNAKDQTALARLSSGHLKTLIFSRGDKKFNICTKCNMIEATPQHLLDCVALVYDDLLKRPDFVLEVMKANDLKDLI
ncbi:hypothetical protein AVEN_159741-1 [Araneus ventricosus]|uniref:DNA helicase Pif1-like 2B domain-containing protein n=1 Tax=Araneus ventricosus TaxID=182803 RepID=A0A4Y2QHB4_ARAVE|nr:hypothetical protein AVEN_159741-1 [Araneus ventricosus]